MGTARPEHGTPDGATGVAPPRLDDESIPCSPTPRPSSRPRTAILPRLRPSGRRLPGQRLCRHCGDSLELQGYCDICESRLRLSVGTKCPKHDVVLVSEEPGPAAGSRAARPVSWVTLTQIPAQPGRRSRPGFDSRPRGSRPSWKASGWGAHPCIGWRPAESSSRCPRTW